jgi:hypothetical protein
MVGFIGYVDSAQFEICYIGRHPEQGIVTLQPDSISGLYSTVQQFSGDTSAGFAQIAIGVQALVLDKRHTVVIGGFQQIVSGVH